MLTALRKDLQNRYRGKLSPDQIENLAQNLHNRIMQAFEIELEKLQKQGKMPSDYLQAVSESHHLLQAIKEQMLSEI